MVINDNNNRCKNRRIILLLDNILRFDFFKTILKQYFLQ